MCFFRVYYRFCKVDKSFVWKYRINAVTFAGAKLLLFFDLCNTLAYVLQHKMAFICPK